MSLLWVWNIPETLNAGDRTLPRPSDAAVLLAEAPTFALLALRNSYALELEHVHALSRASNELIDWRLHGRRPRMH